MKKQQLKNITEPVENEVYDYQKSVGWTFYNEREITERTIDNRFNFLLLVYSLFTSAYFLTNNNIDKKTILIIGFIIVFLLSIGIYRAYTRFKILLEIICSLDDKEVLSIIMKEYKTKRIYKICPPYAIIGFAVSAVMLSSFIVGIIYNFLCI